MQRPNILLITTDQHRADHLGCYGNEVVKTPHIDQFASSGVCFDHFYVSSPVCAPNRSTLVTGRMPSINGVRYNGVPLPLESVTLMEILRRSGWTTSLVGKAHFQCVTTTPPFELPPKSRYPIPEGLEGPMLAGPGRYDQEIHDLWRNNPGHQLDLPYYGFEDVALTIEHGDDVEGDYGRWLSQRHPDPRQLQGPENALPAPDLVAPRSWRTAVPEEDYSTAYIRDVSLQKLTQLSGQDKPFFMWVSFNDPHYPFTPPGHYFDLYQPNQVELPFSFNAPHINIPPALAALAETPELNENRYRTRDETKIRQIIALSYGMITMIDDAIGEIIARLQSLNMAENTIVIFTSDHGEFMGDHGLVFKKYFHYQGLIKVPLIWFDPRNKGPSRRSDLASTLDIMPSILAACQVGMHQGCQGRDLFHRPLSPVTEILIEEDDQKWYPGTEVGTRLRTLVTERWRLTVINGVPWGELYDLANDPHELRNLWDEEEFLPARTDLIERLLRQMMRLANRSPTPKYLA